MHTRLGIVLVGVVLLTILSIQCLSASPPDDIRFDTIDAPFQINTFLQDSDRFFWLGGSTGESGHHSA